MRVDPVFSDEDQDLRVRKWRSNRYGYAVTTDNPVHRDGKRRPVVRLAHRIIAERILGRFPLSSEIVDHINFNKIDNRRENLRIVTWKENARHRQATNRIGMRGVTKHKSGRWQASVHTNGKFHYCGLHDTPDQAFEAAKTKRRQLGFPGEGDQE